LDLDETLVHSCSFFENPDHIIESVAGRIPIKIRPYCLDFLMKMNQSYDIFIFTASSENYATAVVNFIDADKKYKQTPI
jgi:CTD small phosphatase-like protein 2